MKMSGSYLKVLAGLLVLASLPASAGWEVPKPSNPYSTSLSEAWQGNEYAPDIDDPPTTDLLPMNPKREATYNFAKAARFELPQIWFGLKGYHYLLEHGINPKDGWGKKTLGFLGLTLGYQYSVEPSFDKQGTFLRADRYFINAGFEGKTVLKHLSWMREVLGIAPSYKNEMTFYRNFSDPKLAILSVPYFHRNLPYNAAHALKGLNEGDLFTFIGDLNIMTPLSFMNNLSDAHPVGASVSLFYLLSGSFEVRVTRLPENKVRLKVIALRNREKGVEGDVGYDGSHTVFGGSFKTDQVLRLLDTNLIDASWSKSTNRSVVADYILKLDENENSAVNQAYDKALVQLREFNYVKIVDPRHSTATMTTDVVSNMLDIDALWKESNPNNDLNGSVVKVFEGTGASTSIDFAVKFGVKPANFTGLSRNALDKIATTDESGGNKQYLFDFSDRIRDVSLLYNKKEWKSDSIFGVISEADEKFENLNPLAFIMSSETDREPIFLKHASNLAAVNKALGALLPQFQSQIKFPLLAKDEELHNMVMRTQVVMTADALKTISGQRVSEVAHYLVSYIKKYSPEVDTEQNAESIQWLASHISKALDPKLSMNEKMNGFKKLRNSSLFRKVGPGFLMTFMPQGQLEKLVRVDVSVSASGHSPQPNGDGINRGELVRFGAGPEGPEKLYLKLFVNESNTNDSSPDTRDLRLEKESIQ